MFGFLIRRVGPLLALITALAACSAMTSTPSPSPAPTPSPTLTDTPAPSFTPAPTSTATLTLAPTADVQFSSTGPWQLLSHTTGDDWSPRHLWVANEDGTALHEVVSEPVHRYTIRPKRNAHGQVEVAYVTSSDNLGKTDLSLKLLTLPDGKTRQITLLTSPETGWKLGDKITDADRFSLRDQVDNGLVFGAPLRWSPDGHWLAFLAARDGLSLDVYSYDAETGEIRRLTDGSNHAADLAWSNDSRFILHSAEENVIGEGPGTHGLWSAQPDGSGVVQLEAPSEDQYVEILDEMSPGVFLIGVQYQSYSGQLKLLTLSTNAVLTLAPDIGKEGAIAYDDDDHIALVQNFESNGVFTEPGWYLLDAMGRVRYVSDAVGSPYGSTNAYWDRINRVFVVTSIMGPEFGVTPGGEIVNAPPFVNHPSPDGTISVLTRDVADMQVEGFWIQRGSEAPRKILDATAFDLGVGWSPDSKHILLYTPTGRMIAHAPDFIPTPYPAGVEDPDQWSIQWIS